MISEAAVEAAARHLAFYTDRPGTDWTVEARALLEAVAPYMTAEIEWSADLDGLTRVNPYRPAP